MPPMITKDLIESQTVVEGPALDFKSVLNLDEPTGKESFLDDVVAFLNARGGDLIIGVAEKKGVWDHWRPLHDDPDALARKIQSLIQTGIDPTPLGISTYGIALDDGYALVVAIAEHRLQPYQNRLNGAFRIRTDKQNAVLPREEIGSSFKRFEDFRARHEALTRRERKALDERAVMVDDQPLLTISLLPREHFDGHPELRVRDGGRLFTGPVYAGRDDIFHGAPGGHEILTPTMSGKHYHRLFVSDDWFIQASIVHAIYATQGEGRLALFEMKRELKAYFEGLIELLRDNDVKGPFAIEIAFSKLRVDPGLGRFFRHDGPARWTARRLVETLDSDALTDAAYATAERASIYA